MNKAMKPFKTCSKQQQGLMALMLIAAITGCASQPTATSPNPPQSMASAIPTAPPNGSSSGPPATASPSASPTPTGGMIAEPSPTPTNGSDGGTPNPSPSPSVMPSSPTGSSHPGGGGSSGGRARTDLTDPTVSSTNPVSPDSTLAANASINVTFSEAMRPSSINDESFLVSNAGGAVSGTITYSGNTASFNPDGDLDLDADYTVTITTGARDLSGRKLEVPFSRTFSNVTLADILPPALDAETPLLPSDGATGVAINGALNVTFNEDMAAATLNTTSFTLVESLSGDPVEGEVGYIGNTAIFTPDDELEPNTEYTATLSTTITDAAGNALLMPISWSFTTAAAADSTAPIVSGTNPVVSSSVLVTTRPTASFSEPMKASSFTTTSYKLDKIANLGQAAATPLLAPVSVEGTVNYENGIATFIPTSPLDRNARYRVTLTTGVTDLAANGLANTVTWDFDTALGPVEVNLRTAADFVILAQTAITTTGTTSIRGDIGISPNGTDSMTGFGTPIPIVAPNDFGTSPLVFNIAGSGPGRIYGSNSSPTKMTTAIGDLGTAITDAKARPNVPMYTNLLSGALGSQTFTPGLYTWSTDISAAAGQTVTLDGGANDVWIFQTAGNLTMFSGAQVILAGNAQAKNVYWQVTGLAELQSTVAFKGNILSDTQINMLNGATIFGGRALAQTQVTLIANDVRQE